MTPLPKGVWGLPLYGTFSAQKSTTEDTRSFSGGVKIPYKRFVLAQLIFSKIPKQSLYKINLCACSLANRDKPVATTLQTKCSGGIIFVILTNIITKIFVPRNYSWPTCHLAMLNFEVAVFN